MINHHGPHGGVNMNPSSFTLRIRPCFTQVFFFFLLVFVFLFMVSNKKNLSSCLALRHSPCDPHIPIRLNQIAKLYHGARSQQEDKGMALGKTACHRQHTGDCTWCVERFKWPFAKVDQSKSVVSMKHWDAPQGAETFSCRRRFPWADPCQLGGKTCLKRR